MRMLIVDDDRMICAGTARRITGMAFPEVEAVECAYSGEEALERMRQRHFDAMFTDIRMAEMDGLGLIQAAREINPNLICIVITAFDRFQYAQQAIRLGVDDFLVKPLSLESMRRHVRAVIDKYTGMTAQQKSRLELELCAQMLSGERTVDECFAMCGFPEPPGEVCMVGWNALPPDADWRELEGRWLWRSSSRNFLLTEWSARSRIDAAARRMGAYLGVSGPGRNPKRMMEQASEALNFCWLLDAPAAMVWSSQDVRGLSAVRQNLLSELRSMNAEGVRSLLARTLADCGANRRRAAGMLFEAAWAELAELRSMLGMEPAAAAERRPGMGVDGAIQALTEEIERIGRASENPDRLHAVAYAKRYAREHLYESVDMAVVANRLNLSYAYFSRIFREEAGTTFTKYVLQLRMDEVCRLLLAGEKLVDIAEKLGYQNAANLTRSFTRERGLSPSKWLESRGK